MNSEQKIWKISPGKDGKAFKDWIDNNRIGIGWIHTKDLHEFSGKTKGEVKEEVKQILEKRKIDELRYSYATSAPEQIVNFIFDVKKGDIIIAYSSPSTVYGIGIVEEDDWIFNKKIKTDDDNRVSRNSRKVKWAKNISRIKITNRELKKLLGMRNPIFFNVEKYMGRNKFINLISPLLPKESDVWSFLNYNKMSKDLPILNLLDQKSQIILYGPPGTGKTYKAREYALNFIQKFILEE